VVTILARFSLLLKRQRSWTFGNPDNRETKMGWKFWQKDSGSQASGGPGGRKLPKPTAIPDEVGRYLVVAGGYEPDWVWSLQSVARPRPNSKKEFDIRLFNPEQISRAGIAVRNFDSLDDHPQLIAFAGWYNKETRQVQISEMKKAG
jgi:hypothetical protein